MDYCMSLDVPSDLVFYMLSDASTKHLGLVPMVKLGKLGVELLKREWAERGSLRPKYIEKWGSTVLKHLLPIRRRLVVAVDVGSPR